MIGDVSDSQLTSCRQEANVSNYYENPDHSYIVSELCDCPDACHVYTDSTLTTYKSRRSGPEHRVTNGDF